MTLQELAPYLPHGLKFRTSKHQIVYGEFHIMIMRGLSLDNYGEVNIEFLFNDELYFSNEMMLVYPLLRPLSDLTKEITVEGYSDGIPFVPIDEMAENDYYGADEVYDALRAKLSGDYKAEMTSFPYDMVKQMFHWHFDVFGLIEKGEAIDINTLP